MMESNLADKKYDNLPLGISGLGGWLIVVQIGIYATIVASALQLFIHFIPSIFLGEMDVLTSKDSEFYHPLWMPVTIFEAAITVLVLVFCVYILVYFYEKRSILPRLMIIFYAAGFVVALFEHLLIYVIPLLKEVDGGESLRDMVRQIIGCAIWIPYFIKSERVRNTFIR